VILWTVALAALAAAALLSYIVIRYVPIIERNAFNIPRHQVPENHRPAAALKPVAVHIPDLEPFEAYCISKQNKPRCVVVFCHETGANWESWVKHAAFLPEEGIDVLAFDIDDRAVIYQWPSLEEAGRVRAAIEWASRHAPGVPIVLFGISKGSAIAAANDHPEVKGFILDGAFSTRLTLERYIKKWAGIYVGSDVVAKYIPGWLLGLLSRLALHYARFLKQRQFFSIETYIRRVQKPVLFIHAENDPFVRQEEIDAIRKTIPAKTELWVARNAGHSESVEAQPDEYHARVLEFLKRNT